MRHASRSSWLLPAFVLGALAPAPAQAAWPRNAAVNVPVAEVAGEQQLPSILADGDGGSFIAWQDRRGGKFDIYLQRMSATGDPLWALNGVVICDAALDQTNTSLVSDGAGGVIVVWQDLRGSGTFDVMAQRVDANGNALWNPNGNVVSVAAHNQTSPTAIADGIGGVVVAWNDFRNLTDNDVYAQRLDGAGTALWTANGMAISSLAGEQAGVRLAPDGTGGAFFVWHDARSGVYDIYAQRVNGAGAAQWTANGLALCTVGNNQGDPAIAADGMGGCYFTWWDQRGGVNSTDIYGQRVTATGTVLWMPQGRAISTAYQSQTYPRMIPDGANGAIVAWMDFRSDLWAEVFAQRIDAAGSGLWTAHGVRLVTDGGEQSLATLAADGTGGAVFTWHEFRDWVQYDLFAQRVNAAGAVQWGTMGIALCNAFGDQFSPVVANDGSGGFAFAWQDKRNGLIHDIYAQRIDRVGYLGNPEPDLTSVRDVPNDQGGKVKLSWTASFLDVEPTWGITEYRLWRSAPGAPGVAPGFALATSARTLTADPDEAAATGALFVHADYAWELVGAQVAAAMPAYSFVTNTTGDSIAAGNPYTVYMIEARTGTALSANRWFSLPDSGYSVDNLAPAAPAAFTGDYAAGVTRLQWAPNVEPDFAHYRLYRGTDPTEITFVAALPETGHVDAAGAPAFYTLTAVDVHGNESPVALLSPTGTVDVTPDGGLPVSLRLGAPSPNPARLAARIEYDLPRPSRIALVVHDASGRAVRTLYRGEHAAGSFGRSWDLRDDAGRAVASGVYFVRLDGAGGRLTRAVTAVR